MIISYHNSLTFINDCNNNNKISINLEANNDNNNKIKDDNNNTTNKGIYSGSKFIHNDNDIFNLKK